jgi:hypothetical protein
VIFVGWLTLVAPGPGVTVALGGDVPTGCERVALPAAVRLYVKRYYSTFRFVELTDFFPEHQAMWLTNGGGPCSGIAVGHFQDPSRLSHAFLLTRQRDHVDEEMVLFVSERGGRVQATILSGPYIQRGTLVINTAPPGRYQQVEFRIP